MTPRGWSESGDGKCKAGAGRQTRWEAFGILQPGSLSLCPFAGQRPGLWVCMFASVMLSPGRTTRGRSGLRRCVCCLPCTW